MLRSETLIIRRIEVKHTTEMLAVVVVSAVVIVFITVSSHYDGLVQVKLDRSGGQLTIDGRD
jgi:hypothetical protein